MTDQDLVFEESLSDDWAGDLEVVEVPLDDRPLAYVSLAVLLLGLLVGGRVLYLNTVKGALYRDRADTNAGKYERQAAPRGLVVDRNGDVLAENSAIYSAYLNPVEYVRKPELQARTKEAVRELLAVSSEQVDALIADWDPERTGEPLLLLPDLSREQLVGLESLNLPTLTARNSFRRVYPEGPAFSSVLGYVGLTTAQDLSRDPALSHQDTVGKSGLELQYDDLLRGVPGIRIKLRDARGNILAEQEKAPPQIGGTLKLAIDAGLQRYFYERMSRGLAVLGRTSGVGMALDPKTGQVLALINFPTFDNNVFGSAARGPERKQYLTSPNKPLFARATSGEYSPGSTIKPLMGVAALAEKVIDPLKSIFSPGYLDVPNPYNPKKPSRFLDWKYQGYVNLYSALAQSSDVYFYEVGGGFGDQLGLGIKRIREWWQKFGFGKPTGIDLPGEKDGFLPSIEWKEEATGKPWLLGDTYNISIGQGDLTVTPIQLLNYINALANGGILYRPTLKLSDRSEVLADLTYLTPQIREVQKGMRFTVTSPQGTAYQLNDLPFPVAGKTGSAQINNNQSENAFFVGYAPYDDPKITILVLVEHSKEGSLNTIPIVKDVLNWYYAHRLSQTASSSAQQ